MSNMLDCNHPFHCVSPLEPETLNKAPSSTAPVQPVGGKRKRTDGEGEAAAKVAKKQRADTSDENVSPAESVPTKRRGRTRRSQGSKEQDSTEKGSAAAPEESSVIRLQGEDEGKKGRKKFKVTFQLKHN